MSMHKSLKIKGHLQRRRNVLSRKERIEKLMEEGKWTEDDDSVFGLPKVRSKGAGTPGTAEVKREETAEDTESEEQGETEDETVSN